MVVIGAGVLGGAMVDEWGAAPAETGGNGHQPATAPAATGEPTKTHAPTAPGRSAAVTIEFLFPRFGYTFADGQDANGRVTGMPAGSEVWLLVRPEDGAAMIPQGPCATDGATWICVQVRLSGPKRVYILTAVVAPADVAAKLREAREVRAVPLGVLTSDEIVVQG
jgi:hypothetical protein